MYVISGTSESKRLEELLPDIIPQLEVYQSVAASTHLSPPNPPSPPAAVVTAPMNTPSTIDSINPVPVPRLVGIELNPGPSSEWQCVRCHMMNDPGASRCSRGVPFDCNQRRPPMAGIIHQDEDEDEDEMDSDDESHSGSEHVRRPKQADETVIPEIAYLPLLQLILQDLDPNRYNIPFIPIDLIKIMCGYLENSVQDLRTISDLSLSRVTLVEANQQLDRSFQRRQSGIGSTLHGRVIQIERGEDGMGVVEFTRKDSRPTNRHLANASSSTSSTTVSDTLQPITIIATFGWSADEYTDYDAGGMGVSKCGWLISDEEKEIFAWNYEHMGEERQWSDFCADDLRPWLRKLGVLPEAGVRQLTLAQTPHEQDVADALNFLDMVFQSLMRAAGVKKTYDLIDGFEEMEEQWQPE